MKSLKVNIAGREYPLKVTEEEEPIVQQAVDEIHRRLLEYQSQFRTKDKQDHLSMALLTYAVELARAQSTEEVAQSLSSKADSILEVLHSV